MTEVAPVGEIPWRNFLNTAVLKFGISPTEFWKMTPREWWTLFDALFGQDQAEAPLTRSDLEEMESWAALGNGT